jgi:hypothetical protein
MIWSEENVMVAIPRELKTSAGRLPVGVLMPMIAGIGPLDAPAGRLMAAVIVKELPPSPTVMLSVLPERLASNVLGFPGFAPASYFSRIALISARRQRHSALLVMMVPSAISNGFGR